MAFAWNIVTDKVFNILKGSGYTVNMFDKTGQKTVDPEEATRFFATIKSHNPEIKTYTILIALHDEDANSHIDIKTPKITDDADFEKTLQLKNHIQKTVGYDEGISINWYRFDHAINPKDESIHNVTESRDISRAYGTTKSSFQKVGDAKLIVRHSDSIDENVKGSRWRKIHSIFIENKDGERFKYPWNHVNGARAMARHISNEGVIHDEIGQQIQQLSSDYHDLKCSARIFRKNDFFLPYLDNIKNAMQSIQKTIKHVCTPTGYKNGKEILIDADDINGDSLAELQTKLIKETGCSIDDDQSLKSLSTAAKYILKSEMDTSADDAVEDDDNDLQRLQELSGII